MPARWTPSQLQKLLLPAKHNEYPDAERRAAVAVVLRLGANPRVLLMQRTLRENDPWSGQVSLPGGRHEVTDADLMATAHRETHEELGIDLGRDADLLGQLPTIYATGRGKIVPMTVTPVVFVTNHDLRWACSEEAESAFWLPLDRAHNGSLDDIYHYTGLATPLTLPCWRYDRYTVWGLTYKMLRNMIDTFAAAVHS